MKTINSLFAGVIAVLLFPSNISAETIEFEGNDSTKVAESIATQSDTDWINETSRHALLMTFNLGTNFNTGSNGNQSIFPKRPDAATQFNWMMHYSFTPHWSVFTDFGFTYYRLEPFDFMDAVVDVLVDTFLPGINRIHPSVAIGSAYKINFGRFQLMPRAAFGWMSISSRDKTKSKNGTTVNYKYNLNPPFFNPGASIGYRTSKILSLQLDISYRCPLKSTTATLTTTKDGVTDVQKFKTRGWGNDLSVSFGILLQMGLK